MTVIADRYELREPLGSGGMAEVHVAVDRQLGRRVAVKLMRTDLVADRQSRRRLLQEARSAASFHHPNSVAVFDAGEDGGQPFIVMELVEGESLLDRLQRQPRLAPAEVGRIGAGVLAALEAAHERGLVHRDLKPANVLLPHGGGVKLADFGIAKAVADTAGDLTATGDVMGTPKYLSPEQVAGQRAMPASDLYSLGIVLYECLAGQPPFTDDNAVAVAMAHQRRAVPPLRRAAPDVPAELARVVETALAKDAAQRYADAAAMRRALEAAVSATAPGGARARPTQAASPDDARPPGPVRSGPARAGAAGPPGDAARRPRRWRKRLGALVVVSGLAVAAVMAAALLWPEPGGEEPVEAPTDEAPREPAEDAPADEQPPGDEPADDDQPADPPPPDDAPPEAPAGPGGS